MKVVNCCYDDYANYSFENANALKSVGVDAESFNTIHNAFSYDKRAEILNKDQMKQKMLLADVIQIMHSSLLMLENLNELLLDKNTSDQVRRKKIIVYHTGTVYRNEPSRYNSFFNPVVDQTITDQCEFLHLGAKNISYLATAIDTDRIKPEPYKKEDRLIIAHFPSNSRVKGSPNIMEMLRQVKNKNYIIRYDEIKVSNKEQLNRMNDCDIYIELFKPVLNGKPYGCYGVTAFEASALGKIVVTNNIYESVYENAYGECPLFIANTEEKFISTINFLLSLDRTEITRLQNEARIWIENNHSYKATAERIKKLIGIE